MAMNKATKAALFSALIFPGAGLWWLKHYWRACVFIIPGGLALWYITRNLYAIINQVMEKLVSQSLMIDPLNMDQTTAAITRLVDQIIAEQNLHLSFASNLLVACWLCSIASSYFVGKKMDLTGNSNTSANADTKAAP